MLKPLFKYLLWPISFLLMVLNTGSQAETYYGCYDSYKWSSDISFSPGNTVRDKGVLYTAKRQTRNEVPNLNSGTNGSWQRKGMCAHTSTNSCDFDGDGIQDLAKAFPGSALISGKSNGTIPPSETGLLNAGEVTITYGSTSIDSPIHQMWDQNSLGMFAYARKDARFGGQLSVGDYNRDNFCDLAISAPGFNLQPDAGAKGAVNILYGSPNGLTIHVAGDNGRPVNPYDAQRFDQDSPGISEVAEAGDSFGSALATGDINGDGFDDLIVGSPYESVQWAPQSPLIRQTGFMHILYGSRQGIQTSAPAAEGYYQNISQIPISGIRANSYFGLSLALADFDHDGFFDVAIGAPGDLIDQGSVTLLKGSSSGIDRLGKIVLRGDTFPSDPWDTSPDPRRFGAGLYTADYNNDGYIDLLVGEDLWYSTFIPGSASGLVVNP